MPFKVHGEDSATFQGWGAGSSQHCVQQYGSPLSVQNLKTIMKPTAGQPAFSHFHVLIISDNVSDEMLLEKHLWLVEVPNNCIKICYCY